MLETTASLFTVSTVLPGIEELNTYMVLGLLMETQKPKAFREIHHGNRTAKAKSCARRGAGEYHVCCVVT